jgi:hypothetical protein
MRNIPIIYLLLTVAALSVGAQTDKPAPLSPDDEIRFVILSEKLKFWIPDTRNDSICVAVDEGDPNKHLLAKLKEHSKKVKAKSACYLDRNDGDLVRDSMSGKQSVMLDVSGIKKLSKNRVEVQAGSYLGNMASDGCNYILELENGKWKIVSSNECFIS